MPLTRVDSGTVNFTSGTGGNVSTEVFVSTQSTPGIYVAKFDTANFLRQNTFEIWMNDQNYSGGSGVIRAYHAAVPLDSDQVYYTPSVPVVSRPSDNSSYFALSFYSAYAASIPWALYTLGTPTVVSNNTLLLTNAAQTFTTGVVGPGIYQLSLDLTPLANGDEVLVQVNDTVNTGGTSRQSWSTYYRNAQLYGAKYSPPIPIDVAANFVVQQTAAPSTYKTIGYKVLKLS